MAQDWLKSALPDDAFLYHESTSSKSIHHHKLYASIVESIKVERWGNIIPLLSRTLNFDGDMTSPKPVIPSAFRVMYNEANLVNFLNMSLIYCVNNALESVYPTPMVIMPYVSFTNSPLDEGSSRQSETYTPDYTVVQGLVAQNTNLPKDDSAILAVGDVKLIGLVQPKDPVKDTSGLTPSTLGQLLWYSTSRKTRFSFYISDLELVLMEFVMATDRENSASVLRDTVARAELELSSPAQASSFENIPLRYKRKHGGPPSNSTTSPTDRHREKRATPFATAESESGDESSSLSPPPSSTEEQRGNDTAPPGSLGEARESIGIEQPQTPEAHYDSSSYKASSASEVSPETLKDLASAGSAFTVRLFSIKFNDNRENMGLALLKFIALGSIARDAGCKEISKTPIDVESLARHL